MCRGALLRQRKGGNVRGEESRKRSRLKERRKEGEEGGRQERKDRERNQGGNEMRCEKMTEKGRRGKNSLCEGSEALLSVSSSECLELSIPFSSSTINAFSNELKCPPVMNRNISNFAKQNRSQLCPSQNSSFGIIRFSCPVPILDISEFTERGKRGLSTSQIAVSRGLLIT